jgi:hypothetical protein
MIENTPRCRLCGLQLKSTDGCEVCLPVKKVLVWPVITDTSETSAQSVINTTLRALRRRLSRLEKEIGSEKGNYDPRLTRDLATISRTLKELAAEQRKLEDREEDNYNKLGIEGKMDLMVTEFFAQLPEDFQVKLLEKMRDTFNSQNASLLDE